MATYRVLLLCVLFSVGLWGKPYRLLVVVANEWEDPASQIIEGNSQFAILAGSLKTWGLPFDILRLDQQRLDGYFLLDREGRPRYGTIIWAADPGALRDSDIRLAGALVADHGVSLVVLGDSVAAPDISALAGVSHISEYALIENPRIVKEHFITRGLIGREEEFLGSGGRRRGNKVSVQSATVLATRGALPFLAVREFAGGGRVAWLDAHRRSAQLSVQLVRDLLKRCLVWAQGYALYAEYPKSVVIEMHDMGASDKTFMPYWHYPTLGEAQVRTSVIEPLKRRGAVLTMVVNTGFVDRRTQRILNPWTQAGVVDGLDGRTLHDYTSTKRALDAGQREGVFEIQSHGWTHMLPDLDSPPGPFWAAPLDGAATLGWDTEFGDRLRKREIPSATQELHMARSIEYLRADFGVTPLFLRPGGGEYSRSWTNHTGRLAAQSGFGLARFAVPYYLGRERVIALGPVVPQLSWAFNKKLTGSDIRWSTDGPVFVAFHDRDVAEDKTAVERLLDTLGGGVRYMTAGEYCAYLHAGVEGQSVEGKSFSLALQYDDHYGRYFASHESAWVLHISDETRSSLKNAVPEKQAVLIPKGIRRHVIRVSRGGVSIE